MKNASCHGSKVTLPSFNSLTVLFLSSNTTSSLQPLDARITLPVTRWYCRQQVISALNTDESELKLLVYVDQLTLVKRIREVWQILDSSIIFDF